MAEMTEEEFNKRLGMTAEELEALCDAYENDEIEFTERDIVIEGSPLDYLEAQQRAMDVGEKDAERVREIAAERGCSESEIYRLAVHQYLESLKPACA